MLRRKFKAVAPSRSKMAEPFRLGYPLVGVKAGGHAKALRASVTGREIAR